MTYAEAIAAVRNVANSHFQVQTDCGYISTIARDLYAASRVMAGITEEDYVH